MPREMQLELKKYLLASVDNNKSYSEAINRSGPLDNTSIYHAESVEDAANQHIITADDEFWREWAARNQWREDAWRMPSGLAWDHKPHGILGEIFEMDKIRKEYDRYCKK